MLMVTGLLAYAAFWFWLATMESVGGLRYTERAILWFFLLLYGATIIALTVAVGVRDGWQFDSF